MDDALSPLPKGLEINQIKRGVNEVELNGEVYQGTKADCTAWARNKLPKVKSDTKLSYLDELVGQIATGLIPEEIKAKPLQWGKDYEEDARDAYSAATFEAIEEESFIYQDIKMRAGISPDGLIVGEDKGLELKCPWSSKVWCAFAGRGEIKKEEIAQVQFSLMITGFKSWGFAKYDPRNVNCKKLHYVEIFRDEEMIAKLEKGLAEFIKDMDEALNKLGLSWGDQWARK
jgi:predicted phage-related endonuclease